MYQQQFSRVALAVGPLFICDQVILENILDDCIGYTRFHNLTRNTQKGYRSVVVSVSFIIFLVRRNQASFLPVGEGFSKVCAE